MQAWFTVTLTSLSVRPVHSHCWFVGLSPCSQATPSFITCVWGRTWEQAIIGLLLSNQNTTNKIRNMSRLREGDDGVRQHMGY